MLELLKESGLELISNLTTTTAPASSLLSAEAGAGTQQHRDLHFDHVQLRNFGPFGSTSTTTYPLSGRGLVLLRGVIANTSPASAMSSGGSGGGSGGGSDTTASLSGTGTGTGTGTGAGVEREKAGESNGAGKTSLVMSVLWAMSGSMDGRVVSDGRAADVAHDSSSTAGSKKKKKLGSASASASGSGAGTAEVTVKGTINGESFEVVRRRSAKKSALRFILGGTDVTTHSQRDTQALLDRHLGVGSNLLQRACFFGQHASSSAGGGGALLGLTDARLKAELAPLVQHSSLWAQAASSCRQKERELARSIREIEVEMRIRAEERDALLASMKQARDVVEEKQKEEEAAVVAHRDDERSLSIELGLLEAEGAGADAGTGAGAGVGEREAVEGQVQSLLAQSSALQEESIMSVRRRSEALGHLHQDLATLRERNTSMQTVVAAGRMEQRSREGKLALYEGRELEHEEAIRQLLDSYSSLAVSFTSTPSSSSSSLIDDLPYLTMPILLPQQQGEEDEAPLWSSLDWPLASLQPSLRKAQAATAAAEAHVESVEASLTALGMGEGVHDTHDHAHAEGDEGGSGAAECGSCGQPLSPALLQARTEELYLCLDAVQAQVQVLRAQADTLARGAGMVESLNGEYERLCVVRERVGEEREALGEAEQRMVKVEEECAEVGRALNEGMLRSADMQREAEEEERQQQQRREEIVQDLARMERKGQELEEQQESLRERREVLQRRKGTNAAVLSTLRDEVDKANITVARLSADKDRLEGLLVDLTERLGEYRQENIVADTLSALFGTRGIQNYCFGESLQQLEFLSNLFLVALSEGELQLVLRSPGSGAEGEGDGEGDLQALHGHGGGAGASYEAGGEGGEEETKIVRYVLVRDTAVSPSSSSSSVLDSDLAVMSLYKRRALSQLSGGQWKRVQLALDLAFAECVRRRGLLRSNLMVLDEILTHLDTRGREAVGAVLRKMVSLSSSSASSSSASWGDGGGEVERREEYSGLTQTQTQTFIEGDGDDAGLHLLDMLTPLAYDTLILILQDFAAAELEESFDHVDVVTRNSGVSDVSVDGGLSRGQGEQ